ncbi:MAG: DUF92 domain-containing protein [Sphaerochaetaceae bacterium]|nr:DUF92 domain-containing protein [Sphaerochaetaceae bacterium]
MNILKLADSYLFSINTGLLFALMNVFMAAVAVTAFKKKHLSASGAIAAHISGVVVLYSLKLEGFILFFFFYATCNIVGKVCRSKTKKDNFEKKGSCRDAVQVCANGLMAVLASLIYLVTGRTTALIIFGAALAEATSDTLAGEIGRLSSTDPVSIWTRRKVEKGMSGGVTPLGIFGGFLGSAAIAGIWYFFFPVANGIFYALIICLSGLAGCINDSLLGATAQALYLDRENKTYTEKDKDKDGKSLELIRGVRWLDNDMVNLSSNVFSTILALALSQIIV